MKKTLLFLALAAVATGAWADTDLTPKAYDFSKCENFNFTQNAHLLTMNGTALPVNFYNQMHGTDQTEVPAEGAAYVVQYYGSAYDHAQKFADLNAATRVVDFGGTVDKALVINNYSANVSTLTGGAAVPFADFSGFQHLYFMPKHGPQWWEQGNPLKFHVEIELNWYNDKDAAKQLTVQVYNDCQDKISTRTFTPADFQTNGQWSAQNFKKVVINCAVPGQGDKTEGTSSTHYGRGGFLNIDLPNQGRNLLLIRKITFTLLATAATEAQPAVTDMGLTCGTTATMVPVADTQRALSGTGDTRDNYLSACYDADFTIPEGWEALTYTAAGTALTPATHAAGNVVKAGTAVILHRTGDDATAATCAIKTPVLVPEAAATVAPADNILRGTAEEGKKVAELATGTETGTWYRLAMDGTSDTNLTPGTTAFYRIADATAKDATAHRAYLLMPPAANNIKMYAIGGGSGTTGITTATADTPRDGAAYNLAGQRVADTYKGIVIVNGKKTVRK